MPQPDNLSLVIVQVGRPAHPERVAILLVALDHDATKALALLCRWSITGAAVTALRQGPELEPRRRQTLERVHATLLNEDSRAR